ncbi:MAG: hypothetical protein PVG56_14790 [Anaerolineae bacterium]|jgi:hypothetical protein
MANPVEAAWSYRTQQVSRPEDAPVRPVNRRLTTELLAVTGRYLSCIVQRSGDEIRFRYTIRREERGFLKVDLEPDIVIVSGYNLTLVPAERFLSMAERHHWAAGLDDEFVSVVPAVVFGAFGEYAFYVQSLSGFARVEPFFIQASHQFITLLLATHFGTDRAGLFEYVELATRGQDPLRLLEREPLMWAIIQVLPKESRAPFFHQLGAELTRNLRRAEHPPGRS